MRPGLAAAAMLARVPRRRSAKMWDADWWFGRRGCAGGGPAASGGGAGARKGEMDRGMEETEEDRVRERQGW